MISVIFSEFIIYLCVSILMGTFILTFVPNNYRPFIYVKKGILILATVGIALFSFMPILRLIFNLQGRIGWQKGFQTVLLTFDIGKAWIFTVFVVFLLLFFILRFYHSDQSNYSWIGCLLTLVLILTLSWSSHASSLEQEKGLITHLVHFTAVSIWIGTLLIVSWFSKNYGKWLMFLRWFTPLAVGCILSTVVSGIILMSFFVDLSHYLYAWTVNYGNFLLIKQLMIISLLAYAAVNGIFIRHNLKKDKNFNPIPWSRVESIVALLIFSITAAMGQQSPPGGNTSEVYDLSILFELLYQGEYYPGADLQFSLNTTSSLLLIIACLFLAMIFYTFYKKQSAMITILLSILFVFSSYLAILTSLV